MFLKLIALLRVVLPLPNLLDKAAFLAWLAEASPALYDFVSELAAQYRATGSASIVLPQGVVLAMAPDPAGVWAVTESNHDLLCCACAESLSAEELPEKFGDGKILEMIRQLLPLILQILPLFLKTAPQPAPTPAPAPGPVTV